MSPNAADDVYMRYTLHVTNTDAFFALEEALDQFVMNTEDIEDELQEAADAGDEKAALTLRRLNEGRKLLADVTAKLCSLADGKAA